MTFDDFQKQLYKQNRNYSKQLKRLSMCASDNKTILNCYLGPFCPFYDNYNKVALSTLDDKVAHALGDINMTWF